MQHETCILKCVFILLYGYISGILSLKVLEINASEHPKFGSDLTLTCNYDTKHEPLYSIKWYQNNTEIARYMPSEIPNWSVYQISGIEVNLEKTDEQKLTLTNLGLEASGKYTCEVSTDAPSFASAQAHRVIHVVDDRQYAQLSKMGNCRQDDEYFRPDRTHHFDYVITTTGMASGTTNKRTGINIKCEGLINANGGCEYTLHVAKCMLSDMSTQTTTDHQALEMQKQKSDEFTNSISRFPVKFTMANGAVGGVLANKHEQLSMLNVKRGIITALITRRKQNQSDFEDQEIRTDVQGVCPIKYQQHGSKVTVVKYMNKCHFPSRVDWPYSPLSLFWNMSFIQMFWINSTASCTYQFSYGGNLQETSCDERHAILLESTKDTEISVQTKIRHNFVIKTSTSLSPMEYDIGAYELKTIQYEYEKIKMPKHNPMDITAKVSSLLEILTPNEDEPIAVEKANVLNELIHLLRKSSDLSEISKTFHKCNEGSSQICAGVNKMYNSKEIKVAQIWRDALIQCNRMSCIRAFRMLLESGAENINDIIGNSYLEFVFFSWMNVQFDDIEILDELLLIVKARKATRLQILALSSITNTFWTKHIKELENKVPQTLKNIVEYIVKPINTKCTASGSHQVEDVTVALQAMSNMGGLVEGVLPDCLDILHTCITEKEAHWTFSVLAIQVTRRMNPSDNLYHFLLDILQNPKLKHEDHVFAYLMLATKFETPKLFKEVARLLKGSKESGLHYNLKTFIASHMRAVGTKQTKYSKEIREAMSNVQFYTTYETNADTHNCNESQKMQGFKNSNPYEITEDDDVKFSKGFFSNYKQEDFSYGSSFLRESVNRFGYGYSSSLLYESSSYVPYAFWKDHFLTLFGKKISISSIFANTRCLSEIIQASGLEYDINTIGLILQGFNADKCGVPTNKVSNKTMPWNKFPYKVDAAILENLVFLTNQQEHASTSSQNRTKSDGLFTFRFMDDVVTFTNFQELLKKNAKLPQYQDIGGSSFKSNYWKVVEAFNLIPTLIGVSLNWTTDAFLIHNSMQCKSGMGNLSNVNISTTNSFNLLATLRNGMNLDFNGFSNCGVQSFSTISTSIGANVDLHWDMSKKAISIGIELPQRPMQLLSLTRRNTIIENGQPEDIPDWEVDRVSENWCSDKLIPFLGIRLCHHKSYPNVTHHAAKPWTLMAANSIWNYTTEAAAKVPLHIALRITEDNEESQTFEAHINSPKMKQLHKHTELLKFVHKRILATGEFETKLSSFLGLIKASKRNLFDDGYHFKAEYQLLQGPSTILDYQVFPKLHLLSEETAHNKLSKTSDGKKSHLVPVTEINLNITSPENYYGFNYKYKEFPTSSYTDHIFQYRSFSKEPWLWKLIESSIFHEDPYSGWVELHRHVHNSAGSPLTSGSSQLSYNYLKTPKSIIQLNTFQGSISSTMRTMDFNITKHNLPNYELMTFINVSTTEEFKNESSKETKVHRIKVADPWYSITTELVSTYIPGPPDKHLMAFRISRKTFPGADLIQRRLHNGDPHLSWMKQFSSSDLIPSRSSVELEVKIEDNEFPQWESQMAVHPLYSYVFSAADKNVSTRLIYYRSHNETPSFEVNFYSGNLYFLPNEARHGRSFSVEIPTEDLRLSSILNIDFSLEKEILLWQSDLSHTKAGQIAKHSLNVSLSKLDGKVLLSEDLQSTMYNRVLQLVTSYPTLFTPNFDLDMNISANSPIESLLNVNLRQQVNKQKEVMNMTSQLLDIDVAGNWNDGYKKTFNFKSKNNNILPNMKWNIDYPDVHNGTTIHLMFTDIKTDLYIFCQKNVQSTQLLFTICLNKNCTSNKPDSANFVAEVELRLTSPQKLTRIVVYNPKQMILLHRLLTERAHLAAYSFSQLLSGPDHTHSLGALNQAKAYIRSAGTTISREIQLFFNYAGNVVIKDTIITAPTISIAVNTGRFLIEPVLKDSYIEWFWNYFEIRDKIIPWAGQISRQIIREYFFRPGPIHGKSYITHTSIPFYLKSFMEYPTQLSSSFIRKVVMLRNSINQKPLPGLQRFYDENYSRHALLSRNGIVYTFDGMVLNDSLWMENEHCAYLLSNDFAVHKFTVFYKAGIQILFPSISMGINYHGQVTVNNRSTDLPFEANDRDITIFQDGDFIKMLTKYNLKIILSLKNKYFIFYTNNNKHSQLTGMLGNNNDNPADDIQDSSYWELTDHPGCRSIYKSNCHHKCNMNSSSAIEWWRLLWRPDSPTLPCHDILSLTRIAHMYKSCATISEDSVEAYLALCSAKGVPGSSFLTFTGKCDRKKTWRNKIEGELEVIFLIDQATRTSENSILKGVETLAYTIQKHFIEESYEKIQFGLVGFNSQGYRSEPRQHTMNGELLASAKVFAINGLQTLVFNGPKECNGTAAMAALHFAADNYALSEKAVHMFIAVTAQDEDTISALPLVHETLQRVLLQSGTVYTIAGYPAAARSKGIYGIRGDGYAFPQPKTKDELFIDFPRGQLAKLSSATRGAVWQLSYFENSDIPPKRYVQAFASEMVARAKQDSRLCRQCRCQLNNVEKVLTFCDSISCDDSSEKGK